MISYICLMWLGYLAKAPTWYFTLLGFGIFLKVLNYGMTMYKAGGKANDHG